MKTGIGISKLLSRISGIFIEPEFCCDVLQFKDAEISLLKICLKASNSLSALNFFNDS